MLWNNKKKKEVLTEIEKKQQEIDEKHMKNEKKIENEKKIKRKKSVKEAQWISAFVLEILLKIYIFLKSF